MGTARGPLTGNLILDALDDHEREVLLSASRTRPLEVGAIFIEAGDPVETVVFPTSGTVSLLTDPDTDHPVEAATIGREGAANVVTALGSRTAAQRLIGQIKGEVIEIDIDAFAKGVDGKGRLRALVQGYTEALFAQSALNTACNAIHTVTHRCARWLLSAHDRVDSDTFELKQEFLAIMLGVQRPTVSIAAETLHASGCITYKRGVITVVDREALERMACSCYAVIRNEYERLVPRRL
jgi:CRP-like cAMP-binding protein